MADQRYAHYRQIGIERIVAEGARYCDVLAFTEHAHMAEYFKAQPGLIEEARDAYPDMILINGVGYNTMENHHGSLLMPGSTDGMPFLEEFLHRFDTIAGGVESTGETFLEG